MFIWRCLFKKGKAERTIRAKRDTRDEIRISASFHKSWMIEQGWQPITEKLTCNGKMVYFINHKEAHVELSEMDEKEDVCQEQKTL